jgi:hypothetical protein
MDPVSWKANGLVTRSNRVIVELFALSGFSSYSGSMLALVGLACLTFNCPVATP